MSTVVMRPSVHVHVSYGTARHAAGQHATGQRWGTLTSRFPYSFSNLCSRFAGSFAWSLRELPEERGLNRRDHCVKRWLAEDLAGGVMSRLDAPTHKVHGAVGVISRAAGAIYGVTSVPLLRGDVLAVQRSCRLAGVASLLELGSPSMILVESSMWLAARLHDTMRPLLSGTPWLSWWCG